uniref:Uncharacterized protein n=1 Tax=Nelumbo nucifera TaxID=4432 RepID=A0A822XMF0_NELNU|nr:TPA_asm: hypothetical protein HUJ06_022920 [Nelumbo nucifera]
MYPNMYLSKETTCSCNSVYRLLDNYWSNSGISLIGQSTKFTKVQFNVSDRIRQQGNQPEFELGESTSEQTKLIRTLGGKGGPLYELLNLQVNLWGEEGDEEVEDVDTQPIRDDVKTLNEVDTNGIDGGDGRECDPSPENMWGGLVEKILLPLRDGVAPF